MIMKKILAVCLVAGIVVACSKDKFQTKPQISVKSTSSDIVPANSDWRVTLAFTDKEGDVSASIFFVRQRFNKRGAFRDPVIKYKIPDFPNSSQGDIQINFNYQQQLVFGYSPIIIPGTGGRLESDTMAFKFVVKDKEGNKSDTAVANVIIMRQ